MGEDPVWTHCVDPVWTLCGHPVWTAHPVWTLCGPCVDTLCGHPVWTPCVDPFTLAQAALCLHHSTVTIDLRALHNACSTSCHNDVQALCAPNVRGYLAQFVDTGTLILGRSIKSGHPCCAQTRA